MLKFTPERRLTGGLRLAPHKTDSTAAPILRGLVPPRLFVSTRQHRGPAASPIVEVGQTVARGETIARSPTADGADVHAPAAGRIAAIEPRSVPLSAGVTTETCIVIDTEDTGPDIPDSTAGPAGELALTAESIEGIAAAGIVGLGGAVFPTAAKLRARPDRDCELLIINGAECEPYISCDDMLMREAPREIVAGADYLRRLVGARRCIIAIERDKPQAIEAITEAAEALAIEGLSIAELPSIYPAGGERQLVEVLAGVEVPNGSYPADFGFLCQNVGTAWAVCNYIERQQPLTTRIVTVTGDAVAEPRNVEAMIGTPISDLIAACGGYSQDAVHLIHGGSMMGYALGNDAMPVTKSTNCIIVAAAGEVRLDTTEWPCIRCGECAIACPARLQPQDLLLAARAADTAALETLALDECIECGCCDVVCPSHILLTDTFRRAKPLLRQHRQQLALSDAADERYQSREERRQEARREEERRREAVKLTLEQKENRDREIRAAVERARQRKPAAKSDGS